MDKKTKQPRSTCGRCKKNVPARNATQIGGTSTCDKCRIRMQNFIESHNKDKG